MNCFPAKLLSIALSRSSLKNWTSDAIGEAYATDAMMHCLVPEVIAVVIVTVVMTEVVAMSCVAPICVMVVVVVVVVEYIQIMVSVVEPVRVGERLVEV